MSSLKVKPYSGNITDKWLKQLLTNATNKEKDMKRLSALIISEDVVFVSILRRFILNHCHIITIEIRSSFAEVKSLPLKYEVDLIFVDDSISGTANYEVVSYLRFEKMMNAPVYYFGNADTDESALDKGANFLFPKPFNPNEVINHIKSIVGRIDKIHNG